ncbi:MAG: lipopolysaccharide heptosyltransferase II, partial [Candidatus Omnitrophica bacterium]|nr:lipopolysaccharide heptosyltransferase II [Candidatus Omnitrophota bacterium]
MKKNTEPDKVVVLRTDRIGEVLLSTVAIDAIKRRYPEAKISFVTSRYSEPLLSTRADIQRLKLFDTIRKRNFFAGALHLAAMLKGEKFDTAVILNPHKSLHLGCFLAGIPRRIGYDRKWGFLLTDKIPDTKNDGKKHEVEYVMDLLRLIDVKGEVPAPRLFVGHADSAYAEGILTGKGIKKDKPIAVVHPGSSNKAKIWPMDNYSDLVARLKNETGCAVCLIGGKEERVLAERIIKSSGVDAANLAGDLSLARTAALLKRSRLFIGNDAGPMHMAAAMGVKVIAIFGRNIPGVSPARWRPWGEGHVVFHEPAGCSPCADTACPYDHRCLRNITVDA